MAVTIDGTNGITTETGTGDVSVGDDLIFTGTGNRITGDMSNATVTNRLFFQNSVTNGNSQILMMPNGTGNSSSFIGYNSSDPTNASLAAFQVIGSTDVRLQSTINGTGSYLPMTFYTGGSERMRIDTSGNLQFNSGYGSVATAYGCRAWVNFDGTGTPAIREDGNVSSITDNGTGDYTVNMTTAMPDVNYAIAMTVGGTNNAYLSRDYSDGTARTTSAFRIATLQLNQSAIDPSQVNISVFR